MKKSYIRRASYIQFLVKNGMIPWKVEFDLPDDRINLNIPTMLVGLDACHDRKNTHTTVGFVSTYDRDFSRVHGQVSYQALGQEVLNQAEAQMFYLMRNALQMFKDINGVLPQQIFVYRDGVGNYDFEQVQIHEISQIKRAFDDMNAPNINLLFIIIQKRINARFVYLAFVIKTHIVHAHDFQFLSETSK